MPAKKKPLRDKREVPAWMNYGGIEPSRLRPMTEEKKYRRAVYDKLVEIGARDYGIEPNYDDLPIPDVEPEDLVPANIRAQFEYLFMAQADFHWQIGDLILEAFKRFRDKKNKLIVVQDELGHDRVLRVRQQDIWAAVGYFSRYRSVEVRQHAKVCKNYPPGSLREKVRYLTFSQLKVLAAVPENERRAAEDWVIANNPSAPEIEKKYPGRGRRDLESWKKDIY